MTEIRLNHAKRKLLAGEVVLVPGFGPNSILDNDSLEQLGALQLIDAAWIEMEHGPFVWSELGDISRACDLGGISSLVRVNQNDPAVIGRTLDRGVQGVIVPHVNTKAEAKRIVEGGLYAPQGARGMAKPRQSFGVEDYYERANAEILLIAIVEDVEGIRNLDAILSVQEIDCVFIGPTDLAQTMGEEFLGKPMHPEVQAVVRAAIGDIVAAGRACGTLVTDQNLDELLELGVRLLRFPAERFLFDGLVEFRQRAVKSLTGNS